MDAVGIAHDSDVSHQVFFAFFEGGIGRTLQIRYIWSCSHYEYSIGSFRPALKRHFADRFIGSQHDIGTSVGEPFSESSRPVEQTAPAKPGDREERGGFRR